MSSGIDYGNGKTNIDKATGLRYGVIGVNAIGSAWYESSEAVYPAKATRVCEECEGEDEDERCERCRSDWNDERYEPEPIAHKYDDGTTQMMQSDGSPYVWVTRSPYYMLARFCSPCMPGAGNIDEPEDEGVPTYCPGHDWFEGGKAPFTIYDATTHEPVFA